MTPLLLRWRRRVAWRLRVARMLAALAATAVAVRCVPLPRIAALLGLRLEHEETIAAARVPAHAATSVARLSHTEARNWRALQRAARRWPTRHGTCLYESLVLGRVLRRHDPTLKVGIARRGTALHAHAWIVVGDIEIGAREGFAELSRPRD